MAAGQAVCWDGKQAKPDSNPLLLSASLGTPASTASPWEVRGGDHAAPEILLAFFSLLRGQLARALGSRHTIAISQAHFQMNQFRATTKGQKEMI